MFTAYRKHASHNVIDFIQLELPSKINLMAKKKEYYNILHLIRISVSRISIQDNPEFVADLYSGDSQSKLGSEVP